MGELRELLSKGGFRLTKWISISRDVISCVPEAERAPSVKDLDLINNPALIERALGVQWNVQKDTFSYKIIKKDSRSQGKEFYPSFVQSMTRLVLFDHACYPPKQSNKSYVSRVLDGTIRVLKFRSKNGKPG